MLQLKKTFRPETCSFLSTTISNTTSNALVTIPSKQVINVYYKLLHYYKFSLYYVAFSNRFFDDNPVIPLADQKCADGTGCWYCKNLCNTCSLPITGEDSYSDQQGHVYCSYKCFKIWQQPMSPVLKEAKCNSTVMLRVTAVTNIDKKSAVIVMYLCRHNNEEPYVLCQIRTPTFQKFLDYIIDDKFTAVKPLWDECDDRKEQSHITYCLRSILQPAVESEYKRCTVTELIKILKPNDDIISFRQQDYITETLIWELLKPRVSIHMCYPQRRNEVYFLTVSNQSNVLPSQMSGRYGYSIWFTKFTLYEPNSEEPHIASFLRSMSQLMTSYSDKRIFNKVVSVESDEDYNVELLMISEVDTDIRVINAYQPCSLDGLAPVARDNVQPEIDEIWSLMKKSRGIQSIHSLILRERYARLVRTCTAIAV